MARLERTSVQWRRRAATAAAIAGFLCLWPGNAEADPLGRRGSLPGVISGQAVFAAKRPMIRTNRPSVDVGTRKPPLADLSSRVRPLTRPSDRPSVVVDRHKSRSPVTSHPVATVRDLPKRPRIKPDAVTAVPPRLDELVRPGATNRKPDAPSNTRTPDGRPPAVGRTPDGKGGDDQRPPRDRLPPVIVRPDLPRLPPVVIPLPPVRTAPPVAIVPVRPPSIALPPVRMLPLPPLAMPPPVPPRQALPPGPPPPSTQPGGPPSGLADLPTFAPDEVLVTLPDATPETLEASVAQQFNLTILERTPVALLSARIVRLRIPDQRSVAAVIAALQGDARVPVVQPNFIYRFLQGLGQPQPAAAIASTGLQYTFTRIALAEAHRFASGAGAAIAVIDSGVDRRHADFTNTTIEEFDATGTTDLLDPHGTSVAGIIAARGTVQGVAPGARVLSARAFTATAPGQRGGPTAITVGLAKALDWAVGKGATVVNMSFAGPRDPLLERMITTLGERRIVAVAAAGNGGPTATPAYPAAYPSVVAVTATDADDRLYDQANRGSYIALAAPGVDILAPAPGNTHLFQSGTSFAAPHVAGLVGLMQEVNGHLTPDAIRQILIASVDDLGLPGRDEQYGAGRLNAHRAIEAARAWRPALATVPARP